MPWTASADVSFVGQPPRTLNQKMNLPNKLFESIMAGVPVVVSEGNEQCRLTSKEEVGVCVRHRRSRRHRGGLRRPAHGSAEERRALRAHCREVALGKYTWDHTAVGLVELYRKLAREDAPVGPGRSIREGARREADARMNRWLAAVVPLIVIATLPVGAGFGTAAAAEGDYSKVPKSKLTQKPFRGITLITVGDRVVCTGFVVAPNKVATAAHCLVQNAAEGNYKLKTGVPRQRPRVPRLQPGLRRLGLQVLRRLQGLGPCQVREGRHGRQALRQPRSTTTPC